MVWFKMKAILTAAACLIGSAIGLFAGLTANNYIKWSNAFDAGYTQGSVDQAAIQKTLRKGICK